MEPQIIKKFSEETGHKITKCGFFISEKCPFLGASPDGITEEGNIIEVKKVTSKENKDASDTLWRLGIYQRKGSDIFINITIKSNNSFSVPTRNFVTLFQMVTGSK